MHKSSQDEHRMSVQSIWAANKTNRSLTYTYTHRHGRPIRTNFSFLCLHSMRVNMNKFAFKCARWISGSNYYLYDYTAHRAPQHFIDNVMRFDIYNWINFIYKIVTTFVAAYSKFGSRAPESFLTCVVCCWRTTWTEHLCSAQCIQCCIETATDHDCKFGSFDRNWREKRSGERVNGHQTMPMNAFSIIILCNVLWSRWRIAYM